MWPGAEGCGSYNVPMSAMRGELRHLVDELPEAGDLGRAALVMPGGADKLAAFVMRRLLPRATATAVMGRAVKGFLAP